MSLRLIRRAPARSIAVSSDHLARRERRLLLIGLVLLALPVALFAMLRWVTTGPDSQIIIPTEHFVAVSSACIMSLLLAIALGYAAVRTREPRTFFLAATYLMIAAPFSVHGLMTPGPNLLDARFPQQHGGQRAGVADTRLRCADARLVSASGRNRPRRSAANSVR